METDSGQRAMLRRRDGAKERCKRRLRAEARIRLQLCRDAARIASHRGGDGCRRAHTDACTQTAPVDEPPVIKHVTPAPAVLHVAPVPVIEYVLPAPVIEYIAPAPAVTYVVPSQQLPPVYTTTTVTTDDNLDMTGLVCPQFSSTAVEPFAPHVVDSLHLLEEFTEPVYNQVHQEQIAAGETTENIAEIPVVQEQVIVQEIPDVVNSLPPVEELTEPVFNQVHHEQIVAGEMMQNTIGNSAVQEQAIIQEIPPDVEQMQEQIVETIDNEPSSTSTSSSSTSTIRDVIAVMLNSFHNMEKEVERAAMLTKRMMETPLPQPPMVEPPLPEPPVVEPDRTLAKRRRRRRYTPLPRIMENAVYLAPNAWPPIRHT